MRRAWIAIGLAVSPLLIFVAKTGAGPIRWIQRPGLRDVLEFYEHLAGGSNWALLIVCAAACTAALRPGRQTTLGARSVLGNVARPLSAGLAILSGGVHSSTVVRPPGLSGPLHDLLPARTPDPCGCRAGTAALIVAARGRAHRNIASGLARNLLRLYPRLRQRARRLRRRRRLHSRPRPTGRRGYLPHRRDPDSL